MNTFETVHLPEYARYRQREHLLFLIPNVICTSISIRWMWDRPLMIFVAIFASLVVSLLLKKFFVKDSNVIGSLEIQSDYIKWMEADETQQWEHSKIDGIKVKKIQTHDSSWLKKIADTFKELSAISQVCIVEDGIEHKIFVHTPSEYSKQCLRKLLSP